MRKVIIALIILFSVSKIYSQKEWAGVGGLVYKKGLGISLGASMYKIPYMGSRRVESFSFELEKHRHGFGIVPRYSMAFSPHFGLDKGFKRKNKWYGVIPNHYIELAVSPGFFFKDGFGIYGRPEIGYLWNTPFKNFKLKASYGRDIVLKNRPNFDNIPGILSFKFIYVFALTGMYI